MAVYKAPLRDMQFVLKELIGLEQLQKLPGGEELSEDLIDAVMIEAAKLTENIMFPLNASGDEEGCTWNNGEVRTPKGFKEAYQAFVEGGWSALALAPEYGGQGMPEIVSMFMEEMMCAANVSFSLYPGLTRGAALLLLTHGSQELKQRFLDPLVKGTWTGTMCLTEAHCGTDLGLLRTKAMPQKDGTYRLTGTKIFISSGEHDLTDNIIHFVIARTPEGPPGIRGISLFLVPKFIVHQDGSIGERNGVKCTSIEHKMGIKASSTCVMTFEEAEGYLIGDLYKGVTNMFTMMNSERVAVGNQGLGVGEVSYQNAVAYARERLQGRSLSGIKCPDKPADPIIWHPDVRRMLLTMKALNEGNRMLASWVAFHLDLAHRGTNEEEKKAADDFVQLMTPIVKAYLTDCGVDITNLGLQVFGGHGYIRDYGMEQYVRDARIAQIYEGTNGVQSLDLAGRKMPAHMGRYLRPFFHFVSQFIEDQQQDKSLQEFIDPLAKAFGRLQQATLTIAQKGIKAPDEAGAASTDYLKMFGLVASAYLWVRAVLVARQKTESNEKVFYEGKIATARFFMQKLLPQTSSLNASIMAGAHPLMDIPQEAFGPF